MFVGISFGFFLFGKPLVFFSFFLFARAPTRMLFAMTVSTHAAQLLRWRGHSLGGAGLCFQVFDRDVARARARARAHAAPNHTPDHAQDPTQDHTSDQAGNDNAAGGGRLGSSPVSSPHGAARQGRKPVLSGLSISARALAAACPDLPSRLLELARMDPDPEV